MQSFRLFLRLKKHIDIRWKLTIVAYVLTLLSLILNMTQPMLFSYLIDHVFIENNMDLLVPILSYSLGFAALSVIFNIIQSTIFRYLGIQHTLDLRTIVIAHLRKIPLPEIEQNGPGKYSPLIGWDTWTMANFLNHVVLQLLVQWFSMLFAVSMIFYMDWRMGLIAVASIPLLIYIPQLFGKAMKYYANNVRLHNEEIGGHVLEFIQGSREIRSFGLEEWEHHKNNTFYQKLVQSSTRETFFRTLSSQTGSIAISLIIVIMYYYGSQHILNSTLTIGLFVAAVQYFNNALNPIQAMNHFMGDLKQSEVAMQRIEEFLNIPEETAATVKEFKRGSNVRLNDPAVEGHNLRVSYEGAEILRDVNFTVMTGQTAAFVGRSGCGKSTLFKTLLGFMPIESGSLKVEGIPLNMWSRQEIRGHIGAVFQESFLFADTLYENIAIGDLTASAENVYEAACKAGLKKCIDALPEGLYTKLGNQGFQLSGGERQRVAIARVLLQKPSVLILDEPTSALDKTTENEVLAALQELMKGKTTLFSTHRLDTIREADIIYVIDRGEVIDCGSHTELMIRCPYYSQLVQGNVEAGQQLQMI